MASLMAPARCREALWALIALDYEIARTRGVVSDPQLGFIRLQWWQDALAQTAAGLKPPHPVLAALAPILQQDPGLVPLLSDLIEGRGHDLDVHDFPDMAALNRYSQSVYLPFVTIWGGLWGGMVQDSARYQEITQALGLIEVLHGLPVWFQDRRCPLPADLLQAAGGNAARIIDFPKHPALATVMAECCGITGQHVTRALTGIRKDHPAARAAALLLVARLGAVRNMRRTRFQPFVSPALWYAPDGAMPLRVVLAGWNLAWPRDC